ncbi:amidohydrolase family protein [Flagellimonas okinawensis]|uniref:Amidohydrolase family protein n=1 Tax=Flagellimonas okinawensis TaxID=3031324 RepID=A0ABT5XKM5_9FLAO|nr:amidohydrolase family protein [[Muricauda] okinawensis]MDF0706441.1 amidohydrolase family protein [[Muricauda] okinawensis]
MHKNILIFILIVLISQAKGIGQEGIKYIKAGTLYDSKNNVLLKNKLIQIKGTRIVSIDEVESLPKGAEVLDLSNHTVLPGLIDAHTHVLFSQDANKDFAEHSITSLTMEHDGLRTLRGAKRAKSYLYNGITSIKDLGNSGRFLDVALKNAINEGTTEGPRIFASGPILAAQGGQIYDVLPEHQQIINLEYRIIKSPEDGKNAVREHVNQNVDLIKVCADNIPNKTFLSVDEMKSIVQTAHDHNLTVTAHCITNQSAWNAVEAGVDGIEHGFNLADSTLTKMAEKQIYLVPTENSRSYMDVYTKLAGYQPDELDWVDDYIARMNDRLKRAIKKGVQIVAGSDNYTNINTSRGQSSKDMFRYYFEAGMKPLDILQASTYLSAKQFNKENRIGVIAPKAYADIIAVEGDINKDFVNTIDNVVFIMKDGAVYLDATK